MDMTWDEVKKEIEKIFDKAQAQVDLAREEALTALEKQKNDTMWTAIKALGQKVDQILERLPEEEPE